MDVRTSARQRQGESLLAGLSSSPNMKDPKSDRSGGIDLSKNKSFSLSQGLNSAKIKFTPEKSMTFQTVLKQKINPKQHSISSQKTTLKSEEAPAPSSSKPDLVKASKDNTSSQIESNPDLALKETAEEKKSERISSPKEKKKSALDFPLPTTEIIEAPTVLATEANKELHLETDDTDPVQNSVASLDSMTSLNQGPVADFTKLSIDGLQAFLLSTPVENSSQNPSPDISATTTSEVNVVESSALITAISTESAISTVETLTNSNQTNTTVRIINNGFQLASSIEISQDKTTEPFSTTNQSGDPLDPIETSDGSLLHSVSSSSSHLAKSEVTSSQAVSALDASDRSVAFPNLPLSTELLPETETRIFSGSVETGSPLPELLTALDPLVSPNNSAENTLPLPHQNPSFKNLQPSAEPISSLTPDMRIMPGSSNNFYNTPVKSSNEINLNLGPLSEVNPDALINMANPNSPPFIEEVQGLIISTSDDPETLKPQNRSSEDVEELSSNLASFNLINTRPDSPFPHSKTTLKESAKDPTLQSGKDNPEIQASDNTISSLSSITTNSIPLEQSQTPFLATVSESTSPNTVAPVGANAINAVNSSNPAGTLWNPGIESNTNVNAATEAIVEAKQTGQREITMKLAPEAIGEMRVQLHSPHAAQISAKFILQTAEAKDLISSHIQDLRTSLENQGVHLDKVQIVVVGENSLGQQSGQQTNREGFRDQPSASNFNQNPYEQQNQNWSQAFQNFTTQSNLPTASNASAELKEELSFNTMEERDNRPLNPQGNISLLV